RSILKMLHNRALYRDGNSMDTRMVIIWKFLQIIKMAIEINTGIFKPIDKNTCTPSGQNREKTNLEECIFVKSAL
uniref:hypothetical protein n=1 Tax=Acinetobacter baumannii TaxID=470 RepID=UPI001C067E9F